MNKSLVTPIPGTKCIATEHSNIYVLYSLHISSLLYFSNFFSKLINFHKNSWILIEFSLNFKWSTLSEVSLNVYNETCIKCGPSRQVVLNGKQNKHYFVKTELNNWWNWNASKMLAFHQFDTQQNTSIKFSLKFKYFYQRKCIWKCHFQHGRHSIQGVVSLTFCKLFKTISQKYTMSEITFIVRISSWNFICVPKALLWAHVQSFSVKFS